MDGRMEEKGVGSMAKSKVGRKPRWASAAKMQEVIDKYFEDCEGEQLKNDAGEPVFTKYGTAIMIHAKPPTVTGLAMALGFTSRQSLLNYQGKKEFMDTITRAKMRVEEYAERRLYDKDGARGAEFTLKYNFRWAQEEKPVEEDDYTGVVELPAVMEPPPDMPEDGDNG